MRSDEETVIAEDEKKGEALARLVELYRQGRDEEFLARAAELGADLTYPRAVAELFRSLKALEAGSSPPTATERKVLARRLRTLRDLMPAEEPESLEAHRFLDAACRCLALLAELETELWPEEDEAQRSQALVAWLRRTGPALEAALGAPAPSLLAPLRHAVATRWRSVLAGVAARQEAPGLAALWSADPRLLDHHLELPQGGGAEMALKLPPPAPPPLAESDLELLLAPWRRAELVRILRRAFAG